ncbi:hypothetical protein PIB30_088502 [Stylosanthes scabra]|uniref:Uncharacterized protein n=1 Tax=Stylosanthes scabra TaxID=79078 RepID=A0ABU6VUN7_9FABA|nr:hypothetical protein [Stylosanthes scabra]
MPRVKKPTKKSRGASSSMEPPPQYHPLAQWFYNKEDFDLYLSDFAPRKVVLPRLKVGMQVKNLEEITLRKMLALCSMFLLVHQNQPLDYFLTYVLVPRSGNHGLILDEDLEIMWRMVNGNKINWVHLIVTHMKRIKPGNSKGLPYAILWTALFKYVGIDLSQDNKKKLGYNHCIDTHVLNHMKRNEHEAPQQEEEAQPQEPHDNPSEQQSMRDLMELIQSMEHNMGTRLERIEQNQTRMSQRIKRMEQYLYSEDEGDDEDEDQD